MLIDGLYSKNTAQMAVIRLICMTHVIIFS
jgi:hypothetical protein